jgi:hypothetical protein
MHPRLHSGRSAPHDLGDLGVGKIVKLNQDECHALLGWQLFDQHFDATEGAPAGAYLLGIAARITPVVGTFSERDLSPLAAVLNKPDGNLKDPG